MRGKTKFEKKMRAKQQFKNKMWDKTQFISSAYYALFPKNDFALVTLTGISIKWQKD